MFVSFPNFPQVLFSHQDWLTHTHIHKHTHTGSHNTGSRCQQPQQGALQPQFPAVSHWAAAVEPLDTSMADDERFPFNYPSHILPDRQAVIYLSGFPVRGLISQPLPTLHPSYQPLSALGQKLVWSWKERIDLSKANDMWHVNCVCSCKWKATLKLYIYILLIIIIYFLFYHDFQVTPAKSFCQCNFM